MSRGFFKGAKQSGMANRRGHGEPDARLPVAGISRPREWRAFACGGHVAGRIEAGLRRHQGSLNDDAELDRKKTAALLAGFIIRPDTEEPISNEEVLGRRLEDPVQGRFRHRLPVDTPIKGRGESHSSMSEVSSLEGSPSNS